MNSGLRLPLLVLSTLFVSSILLGCAEPRLPYSGPVQWEPISQNGCSAEDGKREYSARLTGDAADACNGPAINIMGAHFANPDRCEADVGYWHVRDSACNNALPSMLPAGSDAVPKTPAEGFADLHNHLLAHVAFGESVFWGASFGEPAVALRPIPEALRGPHQRVEALTSARGLSGIFDSHEEGGHPDYDAWPSPSLKSHQQSHVDWLYRAYQGGLRPIVVHAVNNQDMFGRGENRLSGPMRLVSSLFGSGAQPLPHRTSNDMEALEHQVRAAHELVAWTHAHRGDWLEIAETPEQAAALIASGKLALVLGSEVDHPLNCDLERRCSKRHIREGLTKLEALGLAVVFPTHHKETQFGDSANFQPLNTGPLRACPRFRADCAAIGMSDKGQYLIQEMMRRGLLVDLGHAGDKPFADTMALLQPENYPVLMSHASAHPMKPDGSAEYVLRLDQLQQIAALGGMVSLHAAGGEYAGPSNPDPAIPYAGSNGAGGYVHSYLYTLDAMAGAYLDSDAIERGGQIAFAHDWNGFAGWPYGRFAADARPRVTHAASGQAIPQPPRLEYPLALPTNLVPAHQGATIQLPLMRFAGKTYDFNDTGLAHAGLTPDLVADMRLHGVDAAQLDPLYRSARGFIDAWQRARDAQPPGDHGWLRWLPQSPTDLLDFEYLDESRIVETAPGVAICKRRLDGALGTLQNGHCQPIDSATAAENSVPMPGEVRNANSGLCLTARTGTAGATLEQQVCNDASEQQWTPQWPGSLHHSGALRFADSTLCAGMVGSQSALVSCDAGAELTLQRIGNTFRLQPAPGQCLHIKARDLKPGAPIIAADCPPPGRADFHWEIDSLRETYDYDRLFSTRALATTVRWAAPFAASDTEESLQRPLVTESGVALCRQGPALGVVRDAQCHIAESPQVPPRKDYQLLLSATPLPP